MRSAKAILFGTDRRPGEGIGAGLWATWAFIAAFAAIGGLVDGIWWAALFLIPAAVIVVVAVRRARERNL
ncbi:MAG TPA: hypothetical protein VE596_12555 [Gaiellaceae bacterium]|jgi:membrane protein implicated in regulation of membrane protease activity|nr:hypothetical protein [Gaiellaceae bacterium]